MAFPFSVLIDNVDRTTETRAVGSMRVEYQLGSRGRADLELLDLDSFQTAYRPALDQRLRIGLTPEYGQRLLFDGMIFGVEDGPLGDPGVGTVTKAQGIDDWRGAAQRRVSEQYVAGYPLENIVNHLTLKYLAPFGIALDPGMDPGPTMGAQTFDLVTLEEAFKRLSDESSWIYRIRPATPANMLQWFPVGGKDRVLTLSAANRNILGPVRWSRARDEYINRVILRYGTGLVSKTDAWIGDGVKTSFPLSFAPTVLGWVTYNGPPYPPPGGHEGVGAGNPWTYDEATNSLVRAIGAAVPGGVAGVPPVGVEFSLAYDVQFPQTLISEDAADIAVRGPWEWLEEAADIFERADAQKRADSLRRKYGRAPRQVQLRTRAKNDFLPGDTLTVDIPERTLPNSSWLITGVSVAVDADQQLTSALTLLEGSEAGDSWVDFWRGMLGTGGASSVGIVSGELIPPPVSSPEGGPPPAVAGGRAAYFLGASGIEWVQASPVSWTPASAVQVIVRGRTTGSVNVRLRARAGSVTARLQDLTAGTTAGQSGAIASAAYVTTSFPVTLIEGHTYELQLLPSLPDVDVNGVGYLE